MWLASSISILLLERKKNIAVVMRNCIELDKITLVGWVDKAPENTKRKKYYIKVQRYKDLAACP
jgi:hypothetical protein